MERQKRYSVKEEEFWRRKTLPVEDRDGFIPWDGSFRWFRSPNVTAIEHYRPRPDIEPANKVRSG